MAPAVLARIAQIGIAQPPTAGERPRRAEQQAPAPGYCWSGWSTVLGGLIAAAAFMLLAPDVSMLVRPRLVTAGPFMTWPGGALLAVGTTLYLVGLLATREPEDRRAGRPFTT